MIVVDASIVITSLLPEADSQAARDLLASEFCVAPDLIISECVNALWKNVALGRILKSEADIALEALPNLGVALASAHEMAGRAFALAVALHHPAYDCFYLALAESRRVPLITQDGRFLRKVRDASVSTAQVRLLGQETA